MGLFNWRLTNKEPEVESEIIADLHKKLATEQRHRVEQAKALEKETDKVKKELHRVKAQEAERIKASQKANRIVGINHLRAAERYENAMSKAKGARAAELNALIIGRVEQFTNLGFKLNGSITNTIKGLS